MIQRLVVLSVLLHVVAISAFAQSFSIPELKQLSQMPAEKIDTLLKRKSFRLLEKEKDDDLNLVYYTSLEKTPEGATWVRSITFVEAIAKDKQGRMIAYRTYRKKEYIDMMTWLLKNNYHTSSRTELDGSTHTRYTNGSDEILFKVTKQRLPNGTAVLSYEVELG